MRRLRAAWVLGWLGAAVGVLAAGAEARAGKFNRVLSVGDPAPAWQDLAGVDGQTHDFADLGQAIRVVIFTCNHCPVARAYEDRLIELVARYEPKGVRFVAINVNNLDADKLPAMKDRARERGFNFPYLYDPSQQTGRAYGAAVTPEAYVIDAAGRIAYLGAVDDNFANPAEVRQHYLRDALEALLSGKTPEIGESKPKGCGIQYE